MKLWLGVTLVIYVCVQVFYITATPLETLTLPDNLPQAGPQSLLVGIGPDEKEHFLYTLSLANRGALPRPSRRWRTAPDQYVSYQAQHPPLFYLVAALIYDAGRRLPPAALWYVLRGFCALCGVGVILICSRAAQIGFPDRPALAWAIGPFIAFLPMFGHMTGNLSNEPLAMVIGAWAWLQTARLARSGGPPGIPACALLGVTLGLASLTRLTAVIWLPAALMVIFWRVRDQGPAATLRCLLTFSVCFVVLVAPWFLYNQISYGSPVIRPFERPMLGSVTLGQYLSDPQQRLSVTGMPAPISLSPRMTALWYASTSWWPFWLTQFYVPGFPQAADAWQAIFLILDVFVLIALFLNASRARREPDLRDEPGRVLLWAAASVIGFCVVVLLEQQLYSDWDVIYSAGRYTIAAVPASALLFLFSLGAALRGRVRKPMPFALVVAVVMLLFDVYAVSLVRHFYRDNPVQPVLQHAV